MTQTLLPTACRRATTSAGRAAEREGDGGHRVVLEEHELGLPRVVLEVRLAQRDALAPRLVAQRLDVALVSAAGRGAARHEDVDPEGCGGELAGGANVVAQRVGALVARGHEAEGTGLDDRRGERGRRRAAGQRRLNDRHPERAGEHPR